jgi:hypothetical protein
MSVGWMVHPSLYCFKRKMFFLSLFGWINLKFDGDLCINLNFLFLHFFLPSSSFSSFSPSSSEFEFICIYKVKQQIGIGRYRQQVYSQDLGCIVTAQ